MAAAEAEVNLMQIIDNYIKSNKIMVFSKSYCPYCIKVKELFKSLGWDFFAIELDKHEKGAELQQAMAKKAGRSSVPQVFINQQHVGGCDATMSAHESGKLQTLYN